MVFYFCGNEFIIFAEKNCKNMTNRLLQLLFVCSILFSCQEKSEDIIDTKTKLEIISGNKQIENICTQTKKEFVIKIINPKVDLYQYSLRVRKSCNSNNFEYFKNNNTEFFRFNLVTSFQLGLQKFQIELVDSHNEVIDSIELEVNVNTPDKGWQPSCCSSNSGTSDMEVLPNGKIIDCSYFLYTSDNEGIYWDLQGSFPAQSVQKITFSPSGELFVGVYNGGVYYSDDNGIIWKQRSVGLPNGEIISALEYTKNDKLLAATYSQGIYLSENKGVTWSKISEGLDFNDHFHEIVVDSKNEFYVVSEDNELYKSINQGVKWEKVSFSFTRDVTSIFIDNSDNIYLGVRNEEGELYKSTDGGATWIKIFTSQDNTPFQTSIGQIEKHNGTLYFVNGGFGLFSSIDDKNFVNITKDNFTGIDRFVITNDGKIIFKKSLGGMYYWND